VGTAREGSEKQKEKEKGQKNKVGRCEFSRNKQSKTGPCFRSICLNLSSTHRQKKRMFYYRCFFSVQLGSSILLYTGRKDEERRDRMAKMMAKMVAKMMVRKRMRMRNKEKGRRGSPFLYPYCIL
jgi:hypothetical protein